MTETARKAQTKSSRDSLSSEQRQAVADNMGLIGSFVRDFRGHSEYSSLKYDEWRDILITSLIKAVKSHDEDKGALSTLYYTIASNDVKYELRKPWRHEKSAEVSLDFLVDYGIEPGEVISHTIFEIRDILGEQSELWRLVHLVYLGYNTADISRMEDMSWTTVKRRLDEAYDIIREEYRGDEVWD